MNTRLIHRHCAIGDASVPMRANECLVPVGPVTQRRGLKNRRAARHADPTGDKQEPVFNGLFDQRL
jgi:hypothetical protein